MWPDLSGRVALVTGGTRGLGLAIGRALGQHGARVWLTHRWGSADEEEIARGFPTSSPPPTIVEADVGNDDDTECLLTRIAAEHDAIDVFVSNACVVGRGGSLDRLNRRDFLRALDYSAWPLARYVERIEARLGTPPRTVIATSSDGFDNHYPDYDYVAFSKAALEATAGAMSARHTRSRFFVLRTRHVSTAGFSEIFPPEARGLLDRFAELALRPEEAGNAALAMASGLLDGLRGQVLVLDRGAAYMDNLMTVAPMLYGASGHAGEVPRVVDPQASGAPTDPGGPRSRSLACLPRDDSAFCASLARRLCDAGWRVEVPSSGHDVSLSLDAPPDLLVAGIRPGATPADTAGGVFDLVESLMACRAGTGALPRRVIFLVHGADGGLALALTRSLVIYLTAHTLREDTRINVVHLNAGEAAVRTGVDIALALASGLLDGVRGQIFRAEAEVAA
jgi:NAD(P)-dependent dehydrogenase (short-subunit alcohol dehydrogenase family)